MSPSSNTSAASIALLPLLDFAQNGKEGATIVVRDGAIKILSGANTTSGGAFMLGVGDISNHQLLLDKGTCRVHVGRVSTQCFT